jgi:hypothetical protein
MELAWNICPYCGTPVPGMRADAGDELDETLRRLQIDDSRDKASST